MSHELKSHRCENMKLDNYSACLTMNRNVQCTQSRRFITPLGTL